MKRLFTLLLLVAGISLGCRYIGCSGDLTAEEISALAASVEADEVVMYSSTGCGHCAQAKAWLKQYGFAFTECNLSVESRCEAEFQGYGGDGTPYLVVRGHHMKDGFDSDEFLAALRR